MSKLKVFLSILLIVVLLALMGGGLYLFSNKQFADEEKDGTGDKTYIVLGDSIAEALMGPRPLTEMVNYGYYGVLGQRNGYIYYNQAVSGATSEDCLKFLQKDADRGVNLEYSRLREADIIQLSILGNDFLLSDLNDLFFSLANDYYERIDSIVESSTITFSQIIDTIKEANPNALLLVQTVYNPYHEGCKIVGPELIERLRDELGEEYIEVPKLRELANKLITKLNGIIYKYHEENPDDFVLVDVYTHFNEIYEKDNDLGARLILIDSVHPSSHGHAVIADLTQELLEKENYVKSPEFAVEKYKKIRVDQLDRLYRGTTVNIAKAKSEILRAKTCSEVTSAYFDAIYGVDPII